MCRFLGEVGFGLRSISDINEEYMDKMCWKFIEREVDW